MMTLNNGAFLLDGLQGPKNSSHDLNSGLSGLSISSNIRPLSPATDALDGGYLGFLQQAPSTPVYQQQNHTQPQFIRHQSIDINDPRMPAGNIGAPPGNFSPSIGGSRNQFDLSPQIPPGDFGGMSSYMNSPNVNVNSFQDRSQVSPYPAPISPTKAVGNEIGSGMNSYRERSHSTPDANYNQFPLGAMSPASASTNQILYEDKPLLSPSSGTNDWQNSRPPRHGSNASMHKDSPGGFLPRPGMMRHAVSDGSFNSNQPLGGPMPPSPSSFEASLQKVQLNSTASFGSVGADSNHYNGFPPQQQRMPPQGFMNNAPPPPGLGPGNFIQHEQFLVHQGPVPPNMNRHNPTGSGHFLVNERGEIIGHANQFIHQGMPPQSNVSPTRQRAMSHAGAPGSPLVQLHPPPENFAQQLPPFIPLNDPSIQHGNGNLALRHTQPGSVEDRRVQIEHRSTESLTVDQSSVSSGQSQPRVSSDLTRTLSSGDDKEVEEPIQVAPPVTGQPQSYASKLMTAPRPQPPVKKTSAQPATAGANISKAGQKMIYTVKFKRSQRAFKLGEKVTREVKIGCYVKVEADRGEDLGIVISIVPVDKYVAANQTKSASEVDENPATNIGDMRRIMRAATNDEITLLEVKKEEEDELLKICTTKARQRGLPMTVVDAEYQFDRNKLTFFFEAEGRIDFRELVRDLFSIYKTRIWMQQVNKDECEGKAQ